MAEELSSLPAAKRRRKVLSVENKLEVLKLIDSGTSYSTITRQYRAVARRWAELPVGHFGWQKSVVVHHGGFLLCSRVLQSGF